MKRTLTLLTALLLSLTIPLRAADPAVPRFKLLFSDAADVLDSWGHWKIGVTPVRLLRECGPAEFAAVGSFRLPDGSWEVFARDQVAPGNGTMHVVSAKGDQPYDRMVRWKLLRTTTRDGVTFGPVETVFESGTAAWTDNFAMARHGGTGMYLLLNLKADSSGIAYRAFLSADGARWREHPEALFYDGDAMSLFWSPPLRRFVCVSKTLQPHRKRIIDHGAPTPSLRDDTLRDRRVLVVRTSADGVQWEPDVSMEDVWNRHQRKGSIPAVHLTVPDAEDPPDLEFYSGMAFWYHDRAFMMVQNYAASPLLPRKHGPQLDNEWWTSRDGLRWERPARGVQAQEVPQVPRFETAPLELDGQIVFRRGHLLCGIPEDRITGVCARSNLEFSTRTFTMPDADLVLNAAIPSPARPFAAGQAYVMVSVRDANNKVISGFEPEKCLLQEQDGIALPLAWSGRSIRELAGQTIRLRFQLRSATVFAVSQHL